MRWPAAEPESPTAGVLTAAGIVVADGDLEQAISEGIVTEAEVDAALAALDAGDLSAYVD